MTVMAARHVTGRVRVLKVAVVGDKQVGKTSLVTRFTQDDFSPHYFYTQGGDQKSLDVTINDSTVHVKIVDAAGHHYARSVVRSLYRDVQGVLIVFDVTKHATFTSLQDWIRQINMVNNEAPVIFLVGNKQDLTSHRAVLPEEAQHQSHSLSVPYYETSAKTGHNVHQTFTDLLRQTWQQVIPNYVSLENIQLTTADDQGEDNSCCCIT